MIIGSRCKDIQHYIKVNQSNTDELILPAPKVERIPDTKIDRVSKLIAKYVEFPQFKNADLKKGYFCANCIYFWEGHDDCAIVCKKGESLDGVSSTRIAPYGMCGLWKPNWDVIRGTEKH